MSKQFIQIGRDIINRADIIRVSICEPDWLYKYSHIRIYTRDITGGVEEHGSNSNWLIYRFHSPEGQALLEWLREQSEVLLPCEEVADVEPDEPDHESNVSEAYLEELPY